MFGYMWWSPELTPFWRHRRNLILVALKNFHCCSSFGTLFPQNIHFLHQWHHCYSHRCRRVAGPMHCPIPMASTRARRCLWGPRWVGQMAEPRPRVGLKAALSGCAHLCLWGSRLVRPMVPSIWNGVPRAWRMAGRVGLKAAVSGCVHLCSWGSRLVRPTVPSIWTGVPRALRMAGRVGQKPSLSQCRCPPILGTCTLQLGAGRI